MCSPGLLLAALSQAGECRAVRDAVQDRTRLVMLESPTNPRMQICDIEALCAVAHEACTLPRVPCA